MFCVQKKKTGLWKRDKDSHLKYRGKKNISDTQEKPSTRVKCEHIVIV